MYTLLRQPAHTMKYDGEYHSPKKEVCELYNNYYNNNGNNKSNKNNNNVNSQYTINDLLKGKDLEIIAASLLLLGKLKVDSIQLYRNSPTVTVTLIGAFQNGSQKNNKMADFLNENGDITIDEIFEGIQNRMNNEKGR